MLDHRGPSSTRAPSPCESQIPPAPTMWSTSLSVFGCMFECVFMCVHVQVRGSTSKGSRRRRILMHVFSQRLMIFQSTDSRLVRVCLAVGSPAVCLWQQFVSHVLYCTSAQTRQCMLCVTSSYYSETSSERVLDRVPCVPQAVQVFRCKSSQAFPLPG